MKTSHWVIIAIVVLLGAIWWHNDSDVTPESGQTSPYGFVHLPDFIGEDTDVVYVLAAVNCPHDAAQRADRLAESLANHGIPVKRISEVDFSPPPATWIPEGGQDFASRADMEKWRAAHEDDRKRWRAKADRWLQSVNAVMNGPLPVVFVHGSAANNPTLANVTGQYHFTGTTVD